MGCTTVPEHSVACHHGQASAMLQSGAKRKNYPLKADNRGRYHLKMVKHSFRESDEVEKISGCCLAIEESPHPRLW